MDVADHYPDLVAAKGLHHALTSALTSAGSSLTARAPERPFVTYARVEKGARFSQVYIASKQRLFLVDFWRDGVHLADAKSPVIDDIATAIRNWIDDEFSLADLTSAEFVTGTKNSESYERGTEVEDRWNKYIETIGNDWPELVPFVIAASRVPVLRQLFPYTSLNRFCFSRCTGYPFTRDTPFVWPQPDGTYDVYSSAQELIGNGDADAAVKLVLNNLPTDCGPAVRGTAKDAT